MLHVHLSSFNLTTAYCFYCNFVGGISIVRFYFSLHFFNSCRTHTHTKILRNVSVPLKINQKKPAKMHQMNFHKSKTSKYRLPLCLIIDGGSCGSPWCAFPKEYGGVWHWIHCSFVGRVACWARPTIVVWFV